MSSNDILIANVTKNMASKQWTQGELASKMNRQRTWLNNFLNGNHVPSLAVLDEFAKAFGVTPSSLLKNSTRVAKSA